MASKLEDLVKVATVLTSWLVNPLYLEQKTKRASTTNTFEVFEALFNLRAFEVFETLFWFESLWSLRSSLFIQEFFKSLKLFYFESVFEALFYLKPMPNFQIIESFKGVTIATSQKKENFQQFSLLTFQNKNIFLSRLAMVTMQKQMELDQVGKGE